MEIPKGYLDTFQNKVADKVQASQRKLAKCDKGLPLTITCVRECPTYANFKSIQSKINK